MADNLDWSVVIELATKGGAQTVEQVNQVEGAVKELSKTNKLNEQQEDSANKATAKRAQELQKATGETNRNTESLNSQRYALYEVAAAYGAVSVGLGALAAQGTQAFAELESGFTKVERTSGLYGNALAPLEQDLLGLARTIPTVTNEIQDLAARGAQMGIAADRVAEFSEVMAKFVATSPEVDVNSVAEAFGRLSNLTGTKDFTALASSIAQVGVNSAATDAQIIKTTQELARATSSTALTADEVIGLAAAFASLGVAPEAARGVMNQFFTQLEKGASGMNDSMAVAAQILGTTEEAASSLFKTDTGAFFSQFVSGLSGVEEITVALDAMGLQGQRLLPAFKALAADTERNAAGQSVLAKAMADANEGFRNRTELDKQYAPIADDLNSKYIIMQNSLKELAYTVGKEIAPAFKWMIDIVTQAIQSVTDFVNTPVGGFVAKLVVGVGALVAVYAAIRSAVALSTAAMMAFNTASQSGVAAAGGLSGALTLLRTKFQEITGSAAAATAATTGVGAAAGKSAGGVGVLSSNLGKMAKGAGIIGGILLVAQAFSDLQGTVTGVIDTVEWWTLNVQSWTNGAKPLVGVVFGLAEAFGWFDTTAATSVMTSKSISEAFAIMGVVINHVFGMLVSGLSGASTTVSAVGLTIAAQMQGTGNALSGFAGWIGKILDWIGAKIQAFAANFGKGFSNGVKLVNHSTGELFKTFRGLAKQLPGATGAVSDLGSALPPVASEVDNLADSLGGAGDSAAAAAKEIRTVKDYASDLKSVFDRSFEIRFGVSNAQDSTATILLGIKKAAEESAQKIRDLRIEMRGLNADIGVLKSDISTQKYFLSVAIEYKDYARAEVIQANIIKLQSDLASKQNELKKKQAEVSKEQAANSKTLKGNSEQAIDNRATIEGLVKSYQDQIVALANSGLSQDELGRRSEALRQDFIRQATQLGYNRDDLKLYEKAFDDVSLAIKRVPRAVTVEIKGLGAAAAALKEFQAKATSYLNEVNSSAQNMKNTLSSPLPAGGGFLGGAVDRENINAFKMHAAIQSAYYSALAGKALSAGNMKGFLQNTVTSAQWRTAALRGYAEGGYTGPGGKHEPAGVVHKGEYVVPKKHVNQRTGLPYADALGKLSRGSKGTGYANGGFVRGNSGFGSAVSLTPGTIQQLAQAVQPYLVVGDDVIGRSAGREFANQTANGSY